MSRTEKPPRRSPLKRTRMTVARDAEHARRYAAIDHALARIMVDAMREFRERAC